MASAPPSALQREWVPRDARTLQWNPLRGGLRWYYDTESKKMSFRVENEAAAPVDALAQAGVERTYNQWIKAGWFQEQDPAVWEEAGWNLRTPIEVSIGGRACQLLRGRIYVVGVEHLEQDPFVNAMEGLDSDEVAFVFEGYRTSQNPTLREHVFALEDDPEKLAGMAMFAASFMERWLREAKEGEMKVFGDRVKDYAEKILEFFSNNEGLQNQMKELVPNSLQYMYGALMASGQLPASNENWVQFLLAAGRTLTALTPGHIVEGEEREEFLSDQGFSGYFKRALFRRQVYDPKFLTEGRMMQRMNRIREASMARNALRASNPANAVVICVGELHAAPLAATLGAGALSFASPEAFLKQVAKG